MIRPWAYSCRLSPEAYAERTRRSAKRDWLDRSVLFGAAPPRPLICGDADPGSVFLCLARVRWYAAAGAGAGAGQAAQREVVPPFRGRRQRPARQVLGPPAGGAGPRRGGRRGGVRDGGPPAARRGVPRDAG